MADVPGRINPLLYDVFSCNKFRPHCLSLSSMSISNAKSCVTGPNGTNKTTGYI